eukprot:scaffold9388_cov148-Skeletonema_marinoi.AAC.5
MIGAHCAEAIRTVSAPHPFSSHTSCLLSRVLKSSHHRHETSFRSSCIHRMCRRPLPQCKTAPPTSSPTSSPSVSYQPSLWPTLQPESHLHLRTADVKPSSFGLWSIISLTGALLAGVVSLLVWKWKKRRASPTEDDGWLDWLSSFLPGDPSWDKSIGDESLG